MDILSEKFLKTVGHGPGVYLMKDASGKELYVGKARDLKRRLASYQRHLGLGYGKTAAMLAKTTVIDTILTATEKEALLLEASLIKRHRPKYNVILRDDKSYPYLTVTVGEEWPRLMVTRRRVKDQPLFGPFPSATALRETLRLLNRLFPLRRCPGATIRPRVRPCLNHQMRRCLAPCHGLIGQDEYRRLVSELLLALNGRNQELKKRLEAAMREAAARLDFEQAALCRDRLKALTATLERQVVAADHHLDQDVFGLARQEAVAGLAVLVIREGVISGQHRYFLPDPLEDDALVLGEAINRFYEADRFVPDEVIVGAWPEDCETIEDWLSELKGRRVALRAPQRGDRSQLLDMAVKNAEQAISDHLTRDETWDKLALSLASALHLRRRPERIACLDISHLTGEQTVGSAVAFHQGDKEAAGYRHYRIKTVAGPDDYAALAELTRRHLAQAEVGGLLPDLLLVDGGKGQLRAVRQAVDELGLAGRLDLAGLAKERAAEGEKIFLPGRKDALSLARHSPVLLLLMRIRDEAHRLGITRHRRWRGKEAIRSGLDDIPGLGPARRRALLTAFGSLAQAAQATVAELAAVKGISPALAEKIHAALHQGKEATLINQTTGENTK